jgi:hypothetical protein
MAYEKDGRFWPTDQDRQAHVATFHVPRSTLLSEEERIPGTAAISVVEEPHTVEERLREQFPLYRAVKFGRRVMGFEKEIES